MLLRPLGQLPPALQARVRLAGEALDGLTADEQLEVAGQLTVGIVRAARHPFARSAGDRAAYDPLCDTVEEWVTTEIYKLRFARTQ